MLQLKVGRMFRRTKSLDGLQERHREYGVWSVSGTRGGREGV